MAHQLTTTIDIDAPPAVVWEILTDLPAYADWNPFIIESSVDTADGRPTTGATMTNRMQPPGGRAVTFKPTVTELDDGRVLEWLGRLLVKGLFDGRHRFELAPLDGGTRLHHAETFTGILVPLFKRSLDGGTLDGFHAFNDALKQRAEARHAHEGRTSS